MNDRVSVVVLTTEGLSSHVGGLGTYVRELRNRLPGMGGLDLRFHEIPFDPRYVLGAGFDPDLAALLRGAAIVHANDYFTAYAALLRRGPAKLVTAVHMLHQRFSYEGQRSSLGLSEHELTYIENVALSRSDHLVAVSRFMADELAALGIPLPPVSVVHNGAADAFFRSRYRARPAGMRIGMCGRLIEQKGADLLPAVLARIAQLPLPWTMEIVGTGPHQAPIERAIADLGLAGQCSVRGWVPNDRLPDIYAGWDATLSLSRYEPFGIAPLESLAAGTPVLGRVVGGMREFCEDGRNAIVSTAAGADALVGHVVAYLTGGRPFAPERVRDTVARFTWDRTARRMQDLYAGLASGARGMPA